MKCARATLSFFLLSATLASAQTPASSIFTVVPVPNIRAFPFHSDLAAVSASSANDIWAVGQSGVHFNGQSWEAFALPMIAGDLTSGITGVADLAPDNVWSVGNVNIGEANSTQIIEHFDGAHWSVAMGPQFLPSDQPSLYGLTSISPTDMWAAGAILTSVNGPPELFPLFEHFDGASWVSTLHRSSISPKRTPAICGSSGRLRSA